MVSAVVLRVTQDSDLPELSGGDSQRCSCELSQGWVAGVDEVAAGVVRGDRPEGGPDRLHVRLMRAGRHRAQPGLELGEGLLDRGQIGRVARQLALRVFFSSPVQRIRGN